MIVRLIKRTKIYNFTLPKTISGNYWITDLDGLGNSRNLINIEEDDGFWRLRSNFDVKIVTNNKELDSVILKEHSLHFLRINNENDYVLLYCSPDLEDNNILAVKDGTSILIGNSNEAQINYNYPLVSSRHATLTYQEGTWYLEDLNSNYGTYVNGDLVKSKRLYHGDVIFVIGLKIIVLGDSIYINKIGGLVNIDNRIFYSKQNVIQPIINDEKEEEESIDFYKEEDYFFRSPRFKSSMESVNINIDSPPSKEKEDDTPFIYVLGPMLSMGMTSLIMGYTSIQGIYSGEKDLTSSIPTLIMCLAMLLSMIFWPLLNRRFQRKKQKEREDFRQKRYREYVEEKRTNIKNEMEREKKVLIENLIN